MDLRETGMEWIYLAQDLITGLCEHIKELLGFMKAGQLSAFQERPCFT
jgi:hypothetical protein